MLSRKFFPMTLIAMTILCVTAVSCRKKAATTVAPPAMVKKPELLKNQCSNIIGEPRVEKITDRIWVATGYDLANIGLIHTDDGNVFVDAGMSPGRAKEMKKALLAEASQAPVKALIYTHSHIDHIGGASEIADEGTDIWATDAFIPHFLKQYGMFRPAETRRGMRQFGLRASLEDLPCSAIGKRIDLIGATSGGILLPNKTFSGVQVLEIGGVRIELREAHGETHDTLVVWVPSEDTLFAGDDFYWTYPNIYTIRGTSPRPVNDWIRSIDLMRRLNPEHLVPMHTKPINGKEEVNRILTDYRDGIQWVRDEVVRKANEADDLDLLAESITLPPHLADKVYLQELYGQVDWSAKAIFTSYLGWFDGNADELYPVSQQEAARREVELMGGVDKLFDLAAQALELDDPRWAVHLLAKIRDSGLATGDAKDRLDGRLAQAYRALAATVPNTNGRGYLLERANELTMGPADIPTPKVGDEIALNIPLDMIFEIMSTRLNTEKAKDELMAVKFYFEDIDTQYVVTIRYGIAEVVVGEPLPGTPDPVGTLVTDSGTYRRMALDLTTPVQALAQGKMKIEGSKTKFLKFMSLFNTGV